jgi:aspartate aminotransferase-like enzyme
VDVAPEVLQAMAKPMLPHRSKEYEAIHRSAAEKAQKVFYTKYRVFIGTHSGSGMQETGIRNLAEKDVLSCVNGAFSKRCMMWPFPTVKMPTNWISSGQGCQPGCPARCFEKETLRSGDYRP